MMVAGGLKVHSLNRAHEATCRKGEEGGVGNSSSRHTQKRGC